VRALGAGRRELAAIVGGNAAPVVVLAVALAVAAEQYLVAPGVAKLVASYVSLSLRPSGTAIGATAAGLALGAVVAVLWASRLVSRGPVVQWLREET
jgi:hypothetical protein